VGAEVVTGVLAGDGRITTLTGESDSGELVWLEGEGAGGWDDWARWDGTSIGLWRGGCDDPGTGTPPISLDAPPES
jgi:hypothetical protein